MAVRVNTTEVKQIIEECDLDNRIIQVYINAASRVIDNVFSDDAVLGNAAKKDMELFLTAHMIVSTLWRMPETEKLGDAQIKYTGQYGMALDSTPYGQVLKTLDVTGKLAKMGKRTATMKAITSFD